MTHSIVTVAKPSVSVNIVFQYITFLCILILSLSTQARASNQNLSKSLPLKNELIGISESQLTRFTNSEFHQRSSVKFLRFNSKKVSAHFPVMGATHWFLPDGGFVSEHSSVVPTSPVQKNFLPFDLFEFFNV